MRPRILQFFLLSSLLLILAAAFQASDHDLFRLKDEIESAEGNGVSFYGVLDIPATASTDEISKALKKKSRQLHPDKAKHAFITSRSVKKPSERKKKGTHVSKGPSQKEVDGFMKQATERYSRLGVVAEILKDPYTRERYDHFLKHGFPVWRGTGYYYSRYRPGLGTVLLGLFLSFGGAAHYFILTITYNNQVKHLESYRKYARKHAWGDDESSIGGIPGLGTPSEVAPTQDEPDPLANLNRRQRREYEKQTKKEKTRPSNGKKSTPPPEPSSTGQRRRVTAENGKIFIVDSMGDVYLEEEDEDGNTMEFLLDPSEIPKPTIWDTAVVKTPRWLYRKCADPFLKSTKPVSEAGDSTMGTEPTSESTPTIVVADKLAATDMSSSQISDNGFEIVDSTGLEKEIKGSEIAGAKKRGKKGKK